MAKDTNKIPDDELHEDIELPPLLAVAFRADRPELFMWSGPMNPSEAKAIVNALRVVMQRNQQLRDKLKVMRKIAEDGLRNVHLQVNASAEKMLKLDDADSTEMRALVTEGAADDGWNGGMGVRRGIEPVRTAA